MWVDPANDPRDSGTELVDERGTLTEYLRAYRITLQMKCADLDATQLAQRAVPPSTMSLLGLVRHLAEVERYWFRVVMAGETAPKLYNPDRQGDGEWNGAGSADDVVAQAWGDRGGEHRTGRGARGGREGGVGSGRRGGEGVGDVGWGGRGGGPLGRRGCRRGRRGSLAGGAVDPAPGGARAHDGGVGPPLRACRPA